MRERKVPSIILQIMFILFSGIWHGNVLAQFETNREKIEVESLSFRSYNSGGTGTSGAFYYHTFKTSGMESSRWVGVYGSRMRPYVIDDPITRKYMNRFKGLAIGKQVSIAITLPIIGYMAYEGFANNTPITDHVGLILIAAVPATLAVVIPYGKRSALRKAAEAYNDGGLE